MAFNCRKRKYSRPTKKKHKVKTNRKKVKIHKTLKKFKNTLTTKDIFRTISRPLFQEIGGHPTNRPKEKFHK